MDPAYADGPVNVARAQLQEGDVDAPCRCSSRRSRLVPASRRPTSSSAPRSRRSAATTKRSSTLRIASSSIRAIVSSLEPDRPDSVSPAAVRRGDRSRSSRCSRRSRGPRGALQPDALLPGTGQDRARRSAERTLYTRFKADESAQAITGPYRLKSPDDNNERQSIHEHRARRRSLRSPRWTPRLRS